MSLADAWREVRRVPLLTAAAVLVLVSCLSSAVASGVAYRAQRDSQHQQDALGAVVEALQNEVEVRIAQQCVTSWQAREEFRDATEQALRGSIDVSTKGLVITAGGTADPAAVAQFEANIARLLDAQVKASRAKVHDPDCDLAAAKRRLGQ